MIKKLLLVFIIAIISKYTEAQESKDYEKVKFGKIEQSEFNVKPSGKDSAAAAIVLFDIGYLHFGIDKYGQWTYILERHKRLKILNKKGYNYANFEIPIYSSTKAKEQLNKVQMASYSLSNGKIEQNKAAKDEKFQDKFDKNYTNYKYTVSNVQEGSIIEIKYEIQSDMIYTLRDWYFQTEIPTIWSELTYVLPEYFKYKVNLQPLHPIAVDKEAIIRELFAGVVTGAGTERSENFNFECQSTLTKQVSKNVPAFKDEPYITTDDDFISKVSFEILSTKFPNAFYKSYSSTWEQVISGYKTAERFGGFIKPNSYSKKLISTIIKDDEKAFDKAFKIFNYVKTNIKWNNNNGDYTSSETSLKNIIENKIGNVGDINLSLLNLLKSANLDAKPVILSTRNNGRHPGHPLSSKFNYVIVQLNCDSLSYLLDATNINNSFNIISVSALSHNGFLVDLDNTNGKWIRIDPNEFSSSSITSNLTFDKDLKLKGYSVIRSTNYEALGIRKNYLNFSTEADYLKHYKSNKNGLNITKYSQSEFNNPESPTVETFEYEIEDYIEEAGNLVYFNPLLYERTKENPFKEETRNFPIDFAYPKSENYRLVINIPDGYVVDKLPESINFKLQNNAASFIYSSAQSDNQILISSRIIISASEFDPEIYPDLKELFKQIVTKQSQPLVFKKL